MSAIVLFTWLIFGYTYGTFMAIEYNCPILLRSYRSLPKINELYPKEEQLLRAILYDTPKSAQVLIDEGADINTTKWWLGHTPLSKAAWFGHLECVKLLLTPPVLTSTRKIIMAAQPTIVPTATHTTALGDIIRTIKTTS